jgi:hypothetical protein
LSNATRLVVLLIAVLPTSALASHPLVTEDTGVLGRGVWQLELHGERAREEVAYSSELSPVLSYGVTDRADLQLEQPYAHASGETERQDAVVSLKWRFLEREALSMVLKPDLHEGGSWALNLVAGYRLKSLELLAHAGYFRNRGEPQERRAQRHASLAALYSVSEKLRLALDLARDTNSDPGSRQSVREAVLGLLYAPAESVDLGLGLKRGLSDAADDGALLAGIKIRW